jgi:hypothetical protein
VQASVARMSEASVARMSEAISGVCLCNYNPACRYAHAGYFLAQQRDRGDGFHSVQPILRAIRRFEGSATRILPRFETARPK